jgi:hypothetical protein
MITLLADLEGEMTRTRPFFVREKKYENDFSKNLDD